MRYEICYCAVGGQGIITAASLLVNIAVKMENKHAVSCPTYTAAVRGDPTKVDVIISKQPIFSPVATTVDFGIYTCCNSYNIHKSKLKDDAIIVVDSHLIPEQGDNKKRQVYSIPLLNETKKQAGNIVLASVVCLAITQKLTGIIKYENMLEYIRQWTPKNSLDKNLRAIELGMNLVR